MPRGTPLWIRLDSSGALVPYFEGEFRASKLRIAGRRMTLGDSISAPEYFPDYLTFESQEPRPGGGPPVYTQLAGMWAEFPDPVAPAGDNNRRLKVRVASPTQEHERTLLDSTGQSEFAFAETTRRLDVPEHVVLPRVSANSQPGNAAYEICRWNVTINRTGKWVGWIFGDGWLWGTGNSYLECRINEVICGYGHRLNYTSNIRGNYGAVLGEPAVQLSAGNTYVVRCMVYASVPNLATDGNCQYAGWLKYLST